MVVNMNKYFNIFVYVGISFIVGTMIYNSYLQSQVQKEKLEYYRQASEREDRLYKETLKMLLDTQQKVLDIEKR